MEQHKRRVRYSGKYPKKFEEKYKEHNPEKYADTVANVIEKGSTPAGMHISIMVREILEFLEIRPGQQGLDCTLGYGGHSRKMLEQLQGQGRLVSLDIDPIESEKTVRRLREAGYGEDIFQFWQTSVSRRCRSTTRNGDFLISWRDRWICGSTRCTGTVRHSVCARSARRNLRAC